MHKFARNLLTEWRRLKLATSSETYVVAVSGGADSLSLATALDELRRLKKLNLRFVATHFNHDLRAAESDADELFVRGFAEKFGFEFVCGRIENPLSKIKNQTGNLEQNARRARYDFLFETAGNLHARGVLVAHTLNDQAETFLLNLIRGSGLEGLGGMKTLRSFKFQVPGVESNDENSKLEMIVARPLLNWATREQTENYCHENSIEFRFDSMNENLAYRRVRIRKVLLPLLADFNPKIVETLAKTANFLREDFAELENSAKNAAENLQSKKTVGENVLELKALKNLFPSVRRQILRDWLKNCRGTEGLRRLDSKHLAAIEDLIEGGKSGRLVELPGSARIVKSGGRISFEKTKVEKTIAANYNQRLAEAGASGGASSENNE